MTVGGLLTLIVLLCVVVALVVGASAPSWLPLALIGLLALAVLTAGWPVRHPLSG